MPKDPQAKIVTKKHLARQQREQLQTRYIIYATVAVAVLVIGLVTFGLIDQNILRPNQPVAKVNGEAITASDFQSYVNYILVRYMGGLDPTMVGGYILDDMVDSLLIRQEARKRQISVSAEEIRARMENQLGYYPSGTPVPTATHEPQPTSTYSAAQLVLVTPMPTITPTVMIPTPTPALTVTVAATSTPAPTPTPLTKEGADQLYKDYIQQSSTNGISEKELQKFVEDQVYREKVMAAVLPEIPWEQEQVWYRQIMVPSIEAAETVRTRLQSGEDFTAVALEFNVDTTNNPEVRWSSKASLRTQYDAAYADAVFALQVGDVSAPIQIENSYYVVQMLGHENRSLSTDYERFQTWIDAQRETATIEKYKWEDYLPATTAVVQQ